MYQSQARQDHLVLCHRYHRYLHHS
jgi:hypothetical protein